MVAFCLTTEIIFGGENRKINYLYTATGQKVRKTVNEGVALSITDYIGGYQYNNSVLQFFPHAEGYVKNTVVSGVNSYDYVFNYIDHLENIRLSYGINPATQELTKFEENNYYPFGLKHKNYNYNLKEIQEVQELKVVQEAKPEEGLPEIKEMVYEKKSLLKEEEYFEKQAAIKNLEPIVIDNLVPNSGYNYKYNGKEFQDELDLNWDSFKWRNYDFAIGRFMSIDPLSEKYSYQSHYNFRENRVVDGRELEGLEWASIKNQDGSTTRQVTVQLYNNSSLNDKQIAKTTEVIKEQFVKSFSGEGGNAEIIIQNVTEAKGDFLATLVDVQSNIIYDRETGEEISRGYNAGETGKLGETKNNSFEVVATVDGSNRSDSSIARTFSHELGHTAGLEHPWLASNPVGDIKQGEKGVSNKTVRNNLMNSDQNPTNPSNSGTQLTTGQLKSVDELINKQQN